MTINKLSHLPLYYQLKELIREKIANGEWSIGAMIPSERELSEQYEISRMTARQALKELTTEGILYSEKGKGTFISTPKMQQALNRLSGFTEDMKTRGLVSSAKVLRFEATAPPILVQQALQVSGPRSVVLLERLRLVNQEPFALESCYLNFKGAEGLFNEDMENNSLYSLLNQKFDISPTRAQQQVEADLCSQREEKLLNLLPGAPVLRNRRLSFDQWGRAFEYTESAYRADRYIFKVDLDTSKEVK